MKKLALSLIFCAFGTLFICSQEIFVKNGFTLSRMCAKIPILDKNITNYTIFVGGEYFVHKHYEISSEIGYLVKGGQDEISTVSGYENISKTIPFVQLGTTFRAKLSNQNNAFFVGIGPRVDISLNGGNSIDYYMAQYNMNRCVVGVKAEAGAKTYFNKIGFGFSTQYSFDINPMLYADNIALRNSCIIFTLSVGYRLK
jgi:hypothetical protein